MSSHYIRQIDELETKLRAAVQFNTRAVQRCAELQCQCEDITEQMDLVRSDNKRLRDLFKLHSSEETI